MFESRVFDLGPVGVHQSGFMPTENSRPLHRRVNIRTLVPFSDLVGSSSRARETPPLSLSLSLSHGPLVSIAPHALLSPTWKQISPPCLIAVSVHFIPSTAAVLFSWRAAIRNPSKYRDSISPLAPSLSCCDAAEKRKGEEMLGWKTFLQPFLRVEMAADRGDRKSKRCYSRERVLGGEGRVDKSAGSEGRGSWLMKSLR